MLYGNVLEIAEEQSKSDFIHQVGCWNKIKEKQDQWLDVVEDYCETIQTKSDLDLFEVKSPLHGLCCPSPKCLAYKPLIFKGLDLNADAPVFDTLVSRGCEEINNPLCGLDLNAIPTGGEAYSLNEKHSYWISGNKRSRDDEEPHVHKKPRQEVPSESVAIVKEVYDGAGDFLNLLYQQKSTERNNFDEEAEINELNFLVQQSKKRQDKMKTHHLALRYPVDDEEEIIVSPSLKDKFDAVAKFQSSTHEKENVKIGEPKSHSPRKPIKKSGVLFNKSKIVSPSSPSRVLSQIQNTKNLTKNPIRSLTKQKAQYFILDETGTVTSSPFKVPSKYLNMKSPLSAPSHKTPNDRELVSPSSPVYLTRSVELDRMRMPPPPSPSSKSNLLQSPFREASPSERFSLNSPLLSRPPTTPKYSPVVPSLFGYSPVSGDEWKISDYYFNSEDSSSDDEKEKNRHYKYWCRKENLTQILERQSYVDADAVFGNPNTNCDLEEIFSRKRPHYRRTDRLSGCWSPTDV